MREKISSLEFLIKSKREEKDFTRVRKLDFPTVVNIILQKSAKSLQNTLNDMQFTLKSLFQPKFCNRFHYISTHH